MKKEAKFFRDAAWSQLKGNWKPAVLFTLVYILIASVAQYIGSKSDLVSILISSVPAHPSRLNKCLMVSRIMAVF